jgi:hypothetical protein
LDRELIRLLISYLERQDETERDRLNEWLQQCGREPIDRWFGCCGMLHLLPNDVADELACDFAEHVLPLWEAHRPNDLRPRKSIVARRRWVRGEADLEEWQAAWSAAGQAEAECRVAAWTTAEEVRRKSMGATVAWTCCGGCLLTRGVDVAFIAAWAACNAAGTIACQTRPDLRGQALNTWQADARRREAEWQNTHLIACLCKLLSAGK